MKDERKFRDVVESIVTAEDDVDKILKAARLTRQEKVNPLTPENKFWLLVCVIILAGFAILCLSLNCGSYIGYLRSSLKYR